MTERRRASAPLPKLAVEQKGLPGAIPHIHPLPPQGPSLRRRSAVEPTGQPRRHSAIEPRRLQALSVASPHRRRAPSSTGELSARWHCTLRDGHYQADAAGARRGASKAAAGSRRLPPASMAPEAPLTVPHEAVARDVELSCDEAPSRVALLSPVRRQRTSVLVEHAVLEARRRKVAADTLERLLLPVWRLHQRKRWCRAVTVARHYFLQAALRRRERRRTMAVDCIVGVLRMRTSMAFPEALARLRGGVVRIQRAWRRHQARMTAAVTLNLLRMRRDVEPAYWASVVHQREEELAQLNLGVAAPGPTLLERILSEQQATTGDMRKRRLPVSSAAMAAARPSLELDVYNYYLAGPMPELLLRLEIRRALEAALRRAAAQALYIDAIWQPPSSGSGAQGSTRRVLRTRAHVPVFLPESTYWSVMDNVCYVTSLFRDDSGLRAHLRRREHPIDVY